MLRILYVEDNAANLSLVHRVARIGGHEVVNRTSGERALQDFSKIRPDLVLMDVQLEGALTGLDVVRQLRADGYSQVPIIAVTAYAMKGDKEKALNAGCDDYLPKPLPIKALVALIEKYQEQVEKNKTGEVPSTSKPQGAKTTPGQPANATPTADKTTSAPPTSNTQPATPPTSRASLPVVDKADVSAGDTQPPTTEDPEATVEIPRTQITSPVDKPSQPTPPARADKTADLTEAKKDTTIAPKVSPDEAKNKQESKPTQEDKEDKVTLPDQKAT